ncbi:MAG: MBL fold metallo-hydrolase [Anaerolineaceae bacterium]
MAKITILGSSAAVPDAAHANSQLLVTLKDTCTLIDCGDSTYLRLVAAGIGIDQVTDLILTHFHPDHVGGLPALLITLWLLKRQTQLVIHGLEDTLDRAEAMMKLYKWETWKGFYPVNFHRLKAEELTSVIITDEWKVVASPVCHLIPTIGLRMEFASGSIATYSSDTEPCAAVMRLGKEADLLLHESVGETRGHSSGVQAADIARQAEAKRLVLIHYPAEKSTELLNEARTEFAGEVTLAEDGAVYEV